MEVDDMPEGDRIAQLKLKIQQLSDELMRAKNELLELEIGRRQQPTLPNTSGKDFAELQRRLQRLNEDLDEKYVITQDDIESDGRTVYMASRFNKETTERFSRQIMLPQVGVCGQEKLLDASVLVIGCGGIGSPCIQYLAACGVGTLGLVDYDTVELSNLHRQVIHSAASVGKTKVASARQFVKALNPNVNVNEHRVLLDANNAFDIISKYDVVCDASDNAPTRYLVNDACLMASRPLISASALGMEGQLCVYCYKESPCYRCIYPVPPPPETVGSCGENGVLGPVPGLMGTLQAVEAMKLIIGTAVLDKLIHYDATTTRFLTIRMRPKNHDCICAKPSLVRLVDYEQFCSSKANDKSPEISILQPEEHISISDYRDIFLDFNVKHALLDVRSDEEFGMVHLVDAVQISLPDLALAIGRDPPLKQEMMSTNQSLKKIFEHKHIFVICRRGNDSQKAVNLLKQYIEIVGASRDLGLEDSNKVINVQLPFDSYIIKNIKEGYHGWHKYIDDSIPIY